MNTETRSLNNALERVMSQIAASVKSEEDLDILFKLQNPLTSKFEMGCLFKKAIGYNPITYYDINEISNIINNLRNSIENCDDENKTLISSILNNIDDNDIIIEILNKCENVKSNYFVDSVSDIFKTKFMDSTLPNQLLCKIYNVLDETSINDNISSNKSIIDDIDDSEDDEIDEDIFDFTDDDDDE